MDFAFLIHSRDYTDIQRKFKIAKYLPKWLINFWCLRWPPFVVSKITSLNDIRGWIIGIPMTAKQMLEKRELANKKIIQAINKAEKLGAKIIGLGALTSPLTNGGMDLLDKVNVKITTGNTLTVAISIQHIKTLLQKHSSIQKIAIVGGTGSVGSGISKILVKDLPGKEYLIFGRTKNHLDNLTNELKQISSSTKIESYANKLKYLEEADLIIVATSASKAIIEPQHLKQKAVVYDVTQPQNMSQKTTKQRLDVSVYDGGLVEIDGFKEKLPFGLPPQTIFACMGETMLLALENYQKNFSLGKVEIEKVPYVNKLAEKYDFKPTKLNKK